MARKTKIVEPSTRKTPSDHPLGGLAWVDPKSLHANGYNPNRVFTPEMRLLRLSILEDGWTQPIVTRADGEIVDGFHRWTLSLKFPELCPGGLVPVVRVNGSTTKAQQMISTVRHNRARGQHGVLKMGDIVRGLFAEGYAIEQVMEKLEMEREEVERLGDVRGSPEAAGKDSYGRGWIPGVSEGSIVAAEMRAKARTERTKSRARKNGG